MGRKMFGSGAISGKTYANIALIAASSWGVLRNSREMRGKQVRNGVALLVRAAQNEQRLLVLLVHCAARQVGDSRLIRDRPQEIQPRYDRAAARRRTMLAKVIANPGDRIA